MLVSPVRIFNARLLAAVFILVSSTVIADEITGSVVDVHDGDTMTLMTKNGPVKVRLEGIDAPELNQPYGYESKMSLSKKIIHKDVEVVVFGLDKYGRTIGEIYLNGSSVNNKQVLSGNAWHYKTYSNSVALDKAEKYARLKSKGLWGSEAPIPPWEFRRGKRNG